MKAFYVVLILMLAAPVLASEKGFDLAREKCAVCHAIDPDKPWDSIGSTPSFMLMARKLDRYADRVLTVSGRRPHIGQKLEPTSEELDAILDYIKTLVE